MKYKLKYSPDASEKLRELKKQITGSFGTLTAVKVISEITSEIRSLQDTPDKGASVEALLGISTPYRFLHIEQNYVFYRMENDTIFVVDVFNERENFLWKLFGINLRTRDSIDYWGE